MGGARAPEAEAACRFSLTRRSGSITSRACARRRRTSWTVSSAGWLIAVADLTLAEVLYAMREERHRRTAEAALRKFWQVDLGGFDLAVKSAINYHSLLAKGIDVHGDDCLLATYCLEHGMALLTDPSTAEPFVKHLGLGVPA